MLRQQGAFHHAINSPACRNDFFCSYEHGCFRSMLVAVLKSMSGVVTMGCISETDPRETYSEPQTVCQKNKNRKEK